MIFFNSLCLLLALALDRVFGEAPKFHPLVGFGNLALKAESWLNQHPSLKALSQIKGILALIILIAPFVALTFWIQTMLLDDPVAYLVFSGFVLYTAIGKQSLKEHLTPIYTALQSEKLKEARTALARIVSRDTGNLNSKQISAAATESALENGADAIFCAIFWFLVAGAPGVVLYRLSNTLDAMWGYKNERYLYFGWAAARLDDVLNFVPARLTALSYALTGKTRLALSAWLSQGNQWKSPNAGPVMSAGAGALDLKLGGLASYHGQIDQRGNLGLESSPLPSASDLPRAIRLINHSTILWCACIILFEAFVLNHLTDLLP